MRSTVRHYTQLTQIQRYQIKSLNKARCSQVYIATEIGVDKSTVSRELKRNTGLKGYRPLQAHRLALSRRQDKSRPRIRDSHWDEIERLLRQHWSPEQIAWRLYDKQMYLIGHEWMYQYVYRDKKQGGDLYKYLRCQKQRRKRYGKNDRRGKIPNQRMIDERPAVVDRRNRITITACRVRFLASGTISVYTQPLCLNKPNTIVLLPAPRPRLPRIRLGSKYDSSNSICPVS